MRVKVQGFKKAAGIHPQTHCVVRLFLCEMATAIFVKIFVLLVVENSIGIADGGKECPPTSLF